MKKILSLVNETIRPETYTFDFQTQSDVATFLGDQE